MARNRYFEEGKRLQQASQFQEAYQAYINAIKEDCTCDEAYHILGLVLRLEKKYPASVACLEKAVKLKPNNDEYRYEYGESLRSNKEWVKAEEQFREALRLNKNNPKAWYNLAYILSKSGRTKEAEPAINNSIRLEPTIPDLKWLKALNVLSTGDYETGFRLHEVRRQFKEFKIKSLCREWNGEDLRGTGKTLYVEAEQGFGDVIQYIRFVRLLPADNIVCGVPNELRTLFESSFPDLKICSFFNPPRADYFVLMGSLALKTIWGKTNETLPQAPYLKTNKTILIPRPLGAKRFIGICWSGSP